MEIQNLRRNMITCTNVIELVASSVEHAVRTGKQGKLSEEVRQQVADTAAVELRNRIKGSSL